MVESEAKELPEEVMLGAVMFGHRHFQPVIDAIIRLAEKAAKEPRDFQVADDEALEKEMLGLVEQDLRAAYAIPGKMERHNAVDAAKAKVISHFFPERGETPALVIATLGTGEDEQFVDALEGTYKETFLLHYNFPPFSVGETGRMGAPGRREIGHGKLAWRAILPVLPPHHEFPYTLRVVSEITESNGSSSMATVCGTSLSLMDAGVPLKRPTAGIAMGLILEDKRFAVLSDILGDEDHLGDMDFKVAGTERGVTSLQMDIKIAGITEEIMRVALGQAKDGRMHILGEMAKAIGTARAELGEHAPRIETIKIPTDKIREVIGSGGKVIREIVEKTGAKIDIQDDGTVKIASASGDSIKAAMKSIKSIVAEPEVGEIYEGKVVKIMDFGAFVNFFGPRDGLVHISELAPKRVAKVSDLVKEGDNVKVKLIGIDDRGKVRLSMKVLDQATGKEIVSEKKDEGAAKEQQPAQ